MFQTYRYLRKLVPGLIILMFLFSYPTVGTEPSGGDAPSSRQSTFTHTVLAEDITAVWCVYCPTASETLKDLYEAGELDFYFVCMITQDENGETINDDAQDRANDYKIPGYPTVEFDGGYEEVVGGQSDDTNYVAAIESSGARDVPVLDLNIVANYVEDQKVYVKVTVNNQETSDYSGNLRVYVTEIESRIIDYDGNNYPFGFMDYAINEDFSVGASGSYESEATWDSLTETDANGVPFGIPDPSNIMVIASVFNSQRNIETRPTSPPNNIYFTYYADQTTGTTLTSGGPSDNTPPEVEILSPQKNNKVQGDVDISARVTDNTGVSQVTYTIDVEAPVIMTQSITDPDIYTGTWDSTTVSDGMVSLSVEGKDKAGNTDTQAISVVVSNSGSDTTPPTIQIQSPLSLQKVSGTVTISAKATDDWGISRVEYQIDGGTANAMYKTGTADVYERSWDTSSVPNGDHTILVTATDTSGNSNSDSVIVTVDNSGTTPPVVDIAPPIIDIRDPSQNAELSGVESVRALIYDDTEVTRAECSFDSGNMWLSMSTGGSTEWYFDVDTENYPDGQYTLEVRAFDKADNEGSESISVKIINGYIDTAKPSVKTLVPSAGEILSDVVDITVEVDDDWGVSSVEYRMDTGEWYQMTNARNNVYEANLYTTTYDDGQHTLTIKATDLAGNIKEQVIDIEVRNGKSSAEESGNALPGFDALLVISAFAAASIIAIINRRR
jgi:hypothetical protein